MSDTGSPQTQCEERIINGIDVLARRFNLREDPVPLSTRLGDIGLGDNDCAIVERYVNARRQSAGKSDLDEGTISPASTIQEVIGYAC
jgi:hypothetical protein